MKEKEEVMGYYVDFAGKYFSLRYYRDRLFLNIDIASHYAARKHLFALSLMRDLIYKPDSINAEDGTQDNTTWINGLNDFLAKDFDKICELLNKESYRITKKK